MSLGPAAVPGLAGKLIPLAILEKWLRYLLKWVSMVYFLAASITKTKTYV